MPARLELRPATVDELTREIDTNLVRGRAFIEGASGLVERQRVDLALVHPGGGELVLAAEVVWLAPHGVGVSIEVDQALRDRLRELAAATTGPATTGPATTGHATTGPEPASAVEPAEADELEPNATDEERQRHRNVHERVRALSAREREDLARRGGMVERVALERAYGSAVWEALLANPQVSGPEIARIARNGALPRPLVSVIVANAAWLTQAEVQRALLSNPRCGGRELERVLSAMKPADVTRIARGQSPYRPEVRQLAQRLAKV